MEDIIKLNWFQKLFEFKNWKIFSDDNFPKPGDQVKIKIIMPRFGLIYVSKKSFEWKIDEQDKQKWLTVLYPKDPDWKIMKWRKSL